MAAAWPESLGDGNSDPGALDGRFLGCGAVDAGLGMSKGFVEGQGHFSAVG